MDSDDAELQSILVQQHSQVYQESPRPGREPGTRPLGRTATRLSPLPLADLREVFAMFADVMLVVHQLVLELLLQVKALAAGLREIRDR